ncbi:MAG: hypothetical protein P1T08_04285 [Acidimicrobiia bacterium]|nr:hypothetical protein [Acidimicrobiia bacterium]
MTAAVHSFHIPVMGTGFTIDTPLKVARFGISSVIQIVDDMLIEQMRKFHSELAGETYEEIPDDADDARARRITAYLDLVQTQVAQQIRSMQLMLFEAGNDLTKYFEMLPTGPLRQAYQRMRESRDESERDRLQDLLRRHVTAGSIDVNLMTKVDRDAYQDGMKQAPELSDALSGLRGFARSTLRSAVVFSAGLNPRLYNYLTQFDDFYPDDQGELRKQIVLKVSDFRSALIQGKYLAKRGLWVSEFRVESGLNCGGHTFPTAGKLLGPILDEFKKRRAELIETLHSMRNRGLEETDRSPVADPPELRITVQGGIGTAEEHRQIVEYFNVDSAGWGTPFLLVPEVTNVDDQHLVKLQEATGDDVYLSNSSPFGIPFWSLRTSESERNRRDKIEKGRPGSACPKGYLALSNTEFSEEPICVASRTYQVQKLAHLDQEGYSPEQLAVVREDILAKTCLCRDLAGGAEGKNAIKNRSHTSICTGPNIVNFSKLASLREMVDHIYGRAQLMSQPGRPHMFIREAELYLDFVNKELDRFVLDLSPRKASYFDEYKANLIEGLDYYTTIAEELGTGPEFLTQLAELRGQAERIAAPALV